MMRANLADVLPADSRVGSGPEYTVQNLFIRISNSHSY
jgi:hypothetical protein